MFFNLLSSLEHSPSTLGCLVVNMKLYINPGIPRISGQELFILLRIVFILSLGFRILKLVT
jgi:hypothetical protein